MKQIQFSEETGVSAWFAQKIGGSATVVAVLVPVHKRKNTTVADLEIRNITPEELSEMNWSPESFNGALKWWKQIGGQQKPFVEWANAFNDEATVTRFVASGDLNC